MRILLVPEEINNPCKLLAKAAAECARSRRHSHGEQNCARPSPPCSHAALARPAVPFPSAPWGAALRRVPTRARDTALCPMWWVRGGGESSCPLSRGCQPTHALLSSNSVSQWPPLCRRRGESGHVGQGLGSPNGCPSGSGGLWRRRRRIMRVLTFEENADSFEDWSGCWN